MSCKRHWLKLVKVTNYTCKFKCQWCAETHVFDRFAIRRVVRGTEVFDETMRLDMESR